MVKEIRQGEVLGLYDAMVETGYPESIVSSVYDAMYTIYVLKNKN